MVYIRSVSSIGFGLETSTGLPTGTAQLGTPPTTLTKWMGWQDGDVKLPDPKFAVSSYPSTGQSAVYAQNRALTGELDGSWPIVVGHAYPYYLGMGTITEGGGGGPNYTHTYTHGKTLPTATVHRILGTDASNTSNAINYVGGYMDSIETTLDERAELKAVLGMKFLQPFAVNTAFAYATAQPITSDKSVNSYTSDMLTAFTIDGGDVSSNVPTGADNLLFRSYKWSLKNDLTPIYPGRSGTNINGQFPAKYARGIAKNEITLGVWPEDKPYYQYLVQAKNSFNLTLRLTRAVNDYIEYQHTGCRITDPGSQFPTEADIGTELSMTCRTTTVVEVNQSATIDLVT